MVPSWLGCICVVTPTSPFYFLGFQFPVVLAVQQLSSPQLEHTQEEEKETVIQRDGGSLKCDMERKTPVKVKPEFGAVVLKI